MIRDALSTFEAGLDSLNMYLDSTENDSRLLESLSSAPVGLITEDQRRLIDESNAAHVRRKQYIYIVAIITLYGLFERYIDSVIDRYIQKLSTIAGSYDSLPVVITQNHLSRSIDLLRALERDKFRGGPNDEAEVIKNLHLCLSGSETFRVNSPAFFLHSGNLSLDKVSDFLKGVGIQNYLRRVSVTSPMQAYIKTRYLGRHSETIANADLPKIYGVLDSLVQRRNEVSHGVIDVDDLESVDLLKERSAFLGSYVRGLHCVFLQEVARAYSQSHRSSIQLGAPIAVYRNSIACFTISSGSVSVNNILISKTHDVVAPFQFGRIESIQVNDVDQETIAPTEPVSFGVKVGFRVRNNYEYWVVKDPDFF